MNEFERRDYAPIAPLPGLDAAIAAAPETCRDLDTAADRLRRLSADLSGPGSATRRAELERIGCGLQIARELIWQKWSER